MAPRTATCDASIDTATNRRWFAINLLHKSLQRPPKPPQAEAPGKTTSSLLAVLADGGVSRFAVSFKARHKAAKEVYSTNMKKLFLLLLMSTSTLGYARAQAAPNAARPIRVLTISGDWKSQSWYQDVWMKGQGEDGKGSGILYRGRFIAREVARAAPGRFVFADMTNYEAQQYADPNYLSQFDVVVIGDVVGWSLSPRFLQGLTAFQAQGGVVYMASWK